MGLEDCLILVPNDENEDLHPRLGHPRDCKIYEKHGSGCVLSSAIASHVALKYSLVKSCFKGKRYIEKVLSSNKTLLGYHS